MLTKAIKGFLIKRQRDDAYKKRYKNTGLNWLKIKYLKHVDRERLKYHPFEGKQLAFRNGGELMHGLIEIFADEVYKVSLPSTAKIIDCGANIGLSVLYFKKHHPDAKIIAFEPDAINFELLKENIASYGFTDVDIRKEAVWNKEEFLHFNNAGSQASKISDKEGNSIEVKAIRLKDLLNEKVDFLKIDIEGAEYKVLIDIDDQLKNVEYLFVEYHGGFNQNHELLEILNVIRNNGFLFYLQEAAQVYKTPFTIRKRHPLYDLQLNIFCMRKIS